MPLPNLIVIGAMKCGTTSLHHYLGRHPEIAMSRDKELNFFVAERNWAKGVGWYTSRFPEDARIRGESSPSYTVAGRFSGVPAPCTRSCPTPGSCTLYGIPSSA